MKAVAFTLIAAGLAAQWVSAAPGLSGKYAGHPRSLYAWTADLQEDETLRIQKHLARVESFLRARPAPGLSQERKQRRLRMLDILAAYREAGVFPRNLEKPGLAPVFIDDRGVACAVGHLIRESGRADLAYKVKRADNFVYVPDLDDPDFALWALHHGLTPEECALIQPEYCLVAPAGFTGAHFEEIRTVSVDPAGRIWIGTRHGAVASWDNGTWTRHTDMAQPFRHVRGIAFLPEGKPVVHLLNRPAYFPLGRGSLPEIGGLRGLAAGKDGSLWAYAGGKGLYHAIPGAEARLYPDSLGLVHDIAVDDKGAVWTVGREGIRFFEPDKGWTKAVLPVSGWLANALSGVAPGLDGEMVIGLNGIQTESMYLTCEDEFSGSGFVRVRRKGGTVEVVGAYTEGNSDLRANTIYSLAANASAQRYEIATSQGLARLKLDGRWETVTSEDQKVSSAGSIGGVMWYGMKNGDLSRLTMDGAVRMTGPNNIPESIRRPLARAPQGSPEAWRDVLGRLVEKSPPRALFPLPLR